VLNFAFGNVRSQNFFFIKPPPQPIPKMSADLKLLSIEDLKMLLCIQRKKAAREAEAKRLAEEAA
jgi:hypothetical protein